MEIEPLENLKETVLDLLRVLREHIFKRLEEQSDMLMVEFFFEKKEPIEVMNHVVKCVLPHTKQITKRDVNFFLKNKGIFEGLPDEKIQHYMNMIASGDSIDGDDRAEIWDFFDTIVALAESYKKRD